MLRCHWGMYNSTTLGTVASEKVKHVLILGPSDKIKNRSPHEDLFKTVHMAACTTAQTKGPEWPKGKEETHGAMPRP